MEKQLSAHQFPKVYENLGINLSKLGCLMLDTEPITLPKVGVEYADLDGRTSFEAFFRDHGYTPNNPERFWIKPYVGDQPHVTLLYGFLKEAGEYKAEIEAVLEGTVLPHVEIEQISFFDCPYPDEQYYCIMAKIKKTPELLAIHDRLRMLPHLMTFPSYTPHVTIGYIKQDAAARDMIIKVLSEAYEGKTLAPVALNYGGNKA